MRKELKFLAFAICIIAASCKKEVNINKVFSEITASKTSFAANGQSTSEVTVTLSNESSSDRRTVIFNASAGTFTGSGTSQLSVKAEFENGKLVAKAKLKAPFSPADIEVTAQPEFDSMNKDYVVSIHIDAQLSVPATIKLDPSKFGLYSNFLSEVKLTGYLKNEGGSNVSSDQLVLFEDFLPSGITASGRFRDVQDKTADSSKVSAFYSVSSYPIGTTIKIRTTFLNDKGERTPVKDSVFLTINQ